MFGIVRMFFLVVIFGICIVILGKQGVLNKKRNMLFLFVIITLLWTGSMLLPIENLFISFSTPEKSYSYVNSEDVKLVVYGQESALVVGEDAEYVYLVIPRGEKGWKIGRGIDLKFISNQYFDGIVVSIWQYKHTKEFYVEVTDIDGRECMVSDNQNSNFEILKTSVEGEDKYRYYACVHELNENYTLRVNGEEIILSNQ
jgi:hypothetical protein